MNDFWDAMGRLGNDTIVLFAMVNAVGNLPIFAELTREMTPKQRSACFTKGVTVAAAIVVGFALLGHFVLGGVFQISTAAFQVAGGALVFAVAARGVVMGSRNAVGVGGDSLDDVAIFPLAFPFLAGPGTIVTTILLMQTDGHLIATAAAILVYAAVLPLLWIAPLLERAAGRVAVLVVARVLYIFIAAKAVAYLAAGAKVLMATVPGQ
jgi:multiple antibiotic resistance protein